LRDGAGRPSTVRLWRRFMRLQRRVARRQAAGSSLMTSMRARTSSERLASCVDVVSMAAGQFSARSRLMAWKAATDRPNSSGSLPTSFSEIRRWCRYSAVSSMPLASTGAVYCCSRWAKAR
jgi:hypothetical protein